jgi:hypothetical protein
MSQSQSQPQQATTPSVQQIPLAQVQESGCYIVDGQLWRIPGAALREGQSPVIDVVRIPALMATKISDDPHEALSKARTLCSNIADQRPKF